MSFQEVWAKSVNSDFVCQVQVAMVQAALVVVNEDPTTPNHVNRVAFANRVLQGSESAARTMALGVATNGKAFAGNDEAIGAVVAEQWNAYAGIAPDQAIAVLAASEDAPVVKPGFLSFLKRG